MSPFLSRRQCLATIPFVPAAGALLSVARPAHAQPQTPADSSAAALAAFPAQDPAKVREMGEVLADSKGELYRNPHAIAMEKAEVEFRRLLLEFGLTPAAATRVRADAQKHAADGASARRFFGLVTGGARRERSS